MKSHYVAVKCPPLSLLSQYFSWWMELTRHSLALFKNAAWNFEGSSIMADIYGLQIMLFKRLGTELQWMKQNEMSRSRLTSARLLPGISVFVVEKQLTYYLQRLSIRGLRYVSLRRVVIRQSVNAFIGGAFESPLEESRGPRHCRLSLAIPPTLGAFDTPMILSVGKLI